MKKINLKDLQQSRKNLTSRYQNQHQTKLLNNNERYVYLKSRMPATQTVCEKVLSELHEKQNITSLLDLGCGPGSATCAALKQLPNLTTLHLIDQDNNYTYTFAKPYSFFQQNFNNLSFTQSYDLIIISYALSECETPLIEKVLQQTYEYANKYIVIIEPGTPFGYESFLTTRKFLIDQGACITAPCPHELTCPLVDPDWCHFKIRLPRTKIHQQIKQGTQSFEDESYIFGIFAKNQQLITRKTRIIKKPIKNKGHIIFDLCTDQGLKRTIVSRKDKDSYIKAKKYSWSDKFLI